jgi:hypothetical protein
MFKYQNISIIEQTLAIDGIITPRTVQPGETCTSSVPIENPNFKFIGKSEDGNAVDGIAQPQPNAVTEAELTNTNEESK